MLVGYARVSKEDGSQNLDLQIDALKNAGVSEKYIYTDKCSGKKEKRPGLDACLKALREKDNLVVWKLDRLGRSLHHLIKTVEELSTRSIGFTVLSGKGANINTQTPEGKLMFGVFGALAEFERDIIRERTIAGLNAARARGRNGGRKFSLTKGQVKLIIANMKDRNTNVSELCKELKITRATLYRYVSPEGEPRKYAQKILEKS